MTPLLRAEGAPGLPSLASTPSCTGVWSSSYSTLLHLLSSFKSIRTASHSAEAPACCCPFSSFPSLEFSPSNLLRTNSYLAFDSQRTWINTVRVWTHVILAYTVHFPLLIEMQSPQKPNHFIVEPLFFNPKHGVWWTVKEAACLLVLLPRMAR